MAFSETTCCFQFCKKLHRESEPVEARESRTSWLKVDMVYERQDELFRFWRKSKSKVDYCIVSGQNGRLSGQKHNNKVLGVRHTGNATKKRVDSTGICFECPSMQASPITYSITYLPPSQKQPQTNNIYLLFVCLFNNRSSLYHRTYNRTLVPN